MVGFRKKQAAGEPPPAMVSNEEAAAVAQAHETMEIGVKQLQQEIRSRVAAEGVRNAARAHPIAQTPTSYRSTVEEYLR